MNTIKIKKEKFNIDELCKKILNSPIFQIIGCEGTIYTVKVDSYNNKMLYSASHYDKLDYNVGREKFLNGKLGLVLPFIKIYEEEDSMYNNKSKYEDMSIGMDSSGLDSPDNGIIYIDCYEGYIYISTAYSRGLSCVVPAITVVEENWRDFENVVLDFIKQYIYESDDELSYKASKRPSIPSRCSYTSEVYVFKNRIRILVDDNNEEHSFNGKCFSYGELIYNNSCRNRC